MTYKNCKILIEAGRYAYENMFSMLDLFLLVGRITQEQYIELTGMLTNTNVPQTPATDEQTESTMTENPEQTESATTEDTQQTESATTEDTEQSESATTDNQQTEATE